MTLTLAALTLATAVAATPGPRSGRLRTLAARPVEPAAPEAVRPVWVAGAAAAAAALGWAVVGTTTGAVLTAVAGLGVALAARHATLRPRRTDDDPADLAAAWAQLAVCLEIGLPVAAAVAAAAASLPGRAGTELRRVAGLLELGADPAQAWRGAEHVPRLAAFARAAGRSAATGAALARAARAEGVRLQAVLTDRAEARAQRAAVLVTAPLGLCFLPAFLALGIAPVVIGLAGQALTWW